MHLGAKPLLERHRIFHSRNVEEVRAYLQRKEFHLEVNRRQAAELDTHINGVYLPGMWFGYFQYGSQVATRAVGRDDYWVQLPAHGQIEVAGSARSVVCDARRAAILSPTRADFYVVRSSSRCGRICLSLTKSGLVDQLAALLGEHPNRALEFAPQMDVTSGYGLSLVRTVLMAIADAEDRDSMPANPIALRSFEQLIMTGLLLSHAHSYSWALGRHDKPIAPRDVRRAIDYIEAHLDTSFTIADLVRATGVAGRTLFKHFKDFRGVSPMRYAHNARFLQVRNALLNAEPEENVTHIAMRWGFTHMGRFSVEYRRRFGETPSQTLRRRRSRP